MVRLVFRPYTQIRRSICTSEPLRASTRVSPGFALFRHSSPSFGSQHACSHSNLSPEGSWSADGAVAVGWSALQPRVGRARRQWLSIPTSRRPINKILAFTPRRGFHAPALARMLDSLVRVSRRGKENHFDSDRLDTRPATGRARRTIGFPKEAYPPATRLPGPEPTLTPAAAARPRVGTTRPRQPRGHDTGFLRFPFSNFRYF